ncbi:hypothetical protein O0L34_g10321 [Tuta absoluta]|nr:hypothetical protein O0L34_g10321 [Tuta absoluta]
MFRYIILVLSVVASNASVIQINGGGDKELVLAFAVHRHGDRTPDADELSLSNMQAQILNKTRLEGLEGLTNAGKRRAYQIGKFIRQRYGPQGLDLISNLYLQEEISVRSTDKERTKMTALVAMAAAYPPQVEQQWDEDLGKVWQPVPYTCVPLSEDFLRYYSNCKKYMTLMALAKEECLLEEFLPYQDLVATAERETGRNFTENPLLFQSLLDLLRSQRSLGLGVPGWTEPLIPRINAAAELAYKLYFRSEEMKRLGGGVLLYDFLEAATLLLHDQPVSKRLRIFSAHDFNIGALIAVTKTVKEQTIPDYGSVFMLELYRSRSGLYTVEPVYLDQAGEGPAQPLHIAGCGTPCPLAKFRALTQEYALPLHEFKRVCG